MNVLEPSRYLPDPDAVEVTIGCRRDAEAEACPACGGSGRVTCPGYTPIICPDCHGTGTRL